MRKITLFLASLFVTIGAMAQVYQVTDTRYTSAELNAKTEATYIAIKNLSATNHYYFVGNTGATPYSKADFSNDAVFIWEPVAGEAGKFYLKKLDGSYMQTSSPKDFGTIEKAATFTTTNPTSIGSGSTKFNGDGDSQAYINGNDDPNLVRFVTDSKWINVQNGDNGTPTYNTGLGGWTIHFAYALEEISAVKVTYNYQLNGVTKLSKTVDQGVGTAYAAPAIDIDYVTFTQPEGVVPAGGATVNVACSENLPFAVTTDLNTPIWQTVEMHRYGTFRVWEYDGQDKEVKVTNINKEEGVADAMLWCFTGNIFDGFKIYNKAAGTGVTLNATASNATVGTAAEGNDVWKLKVGAASADVAACFTNDGANYMNHQDGVIKYWGSNDNGSTCYFYAPGQLVYEAATEFFGIPEGVVGSYLLEEEVEVAINALCALGVDELIAKSVEEVQIAAQTVKDARASEQVAYADGYYRIYSAQPGLYANNKGLIYNVAGSASNPFRWGTIEETNVDAIVRLTTDNGKVVLQTVNTALYVQGVLGASNPNMTDNGHITLTPLGFAQYNLVFGNGTMHAEGHNEGAGSDGALVSWPGSVNSASAWYLVPATELEVALNTVDGASYATGYYPFPVSANGNTTLNVGVLNADKSKLGLAAVDGVPANTGVVIVNSAAEPTTTLTIGGEFEAAGSNALTGSCTAVTENIANYLVLGVGATTGALGFYETTATEIPANKAFLEAGSLSAVKLDLGGDVTAIENVELGNTNAPIFDLSGRRVLVPAKGGVYVRDGKKFIVK